MRTATMVGRTTASGVDSREKAEAFARKWIANWNALNVEAVLSHFAEQVHFISPKAATIVGNAELHGKAALRHYWETGVKQITSLHFTMDFVVWDADRRSLTLFYDAEISGIKTRACELMVFDAEGWQISGEALYGAVLAA